jgi:hypothetical protein
MEPEKIEYVKIQCPKCHSIIKGEKITYKNFIFNGYYGHCDVCDYVITESEWEEVK